MTYSNISFKSLKSCWFLGVKDIFKKNTMFLSREIELFKAPITQDALNFVQ